MESKESVREKNSYLAIVSCLRRNFGQLDSQLLNQEKFWKRKKRSNEELAEYDQDLNDLACKAFGAMKANKESFNKMLANRFVTGLEDDHMGRWVHMSHPADLEEAVDIVQKYAAKACSTVTYRK